MRLLAIIRKSFEVPGVFSPIIIVVCAILLSAPHAWVAAVYDAENEQLTLTSEGGPNTSESIVADLGDDTLASTDGMVTTINIPIIVVAADAEWVIEDGETVIVTDPIYPRTTKPQININGTTSITGGTLSGFIEMNIADGASVNWLDASLLADQASFGSTRLTNGVVVINGVPEEFVWDGGVLDLTGPGEPDDLAFEGIRFRPSLAGDNEVALTCSNVTINSRFYVIRSLFGGEGDNDTFTFDQCTFNMTVNNVYFDNGSPSCTYNFVDCEFPDGASYGVRFSADETSSCNLMNTITASGVSEGTVITAESIPEGAETIGLPTMTDSDGMASFALTYQAFIGPDNGNDVPEYLYTITGGGASVSNFNPATEDTVSLMQSSVSAFEIYR